MAKKKTPGKPQSQPKATKEAKSPSSSRLIVWGAVLAVLAITFGCFYQVLDFGFVHWDDDRNIFKNPHITSLQGENFWANTKEIWTSTVIGNYNPLTIWTFALEKMAYGMDNLGMWHLTNVLLHLVCVFFVYLISNLLGLSWRAATVVALLYGIHPMRVESVAWLTERKDVLYGSFYFAALWLYIKGKLGDRSYWLIIIPLFVLSLLSKIQAVVLPISMILVDYYLSGKLEVRTIMRKIPLLLISLAFGLLGIAFLSEEGSLASNSNTYEAWQRIFVGSYSYCVYLVKAVVPYQLSPLYPYPPDMPVHYYPSLLVVPAVLWLLYKSFVNGYRAVVFGILFFTANIFFLLQILGAGQGFLADRFTYVPYFGLFFMAGYGLDKLWQMYDSKKLVMGIAVVAIMAGYGVKTIQQVSIWENTETLWSHVLEYYDRSTLPYGNRANYRRDIGQHEAALEDYSKSIALQPTSEAYNSRARLYFSLARSQDTLMLALQDYSRAIEMNPTKGEFYVNRGATYARLGQGQQAITDISRGLELQPDHAVGYLNRSVINNQMGNLPEALADIDQYLQLKPYNADMWYEKARVERSLGKAQQSLTAYSRAIELKPSQAVYWHERARTKAILSDAAGARSDLGRAITLGYKNVDAKLRASLGM